MRRSLHEMRIQVATPNHEEGMGFRLIMSVPGVICVSGGGRGEYLPMSWGFYYKSAALDFQERLGIRLICGQRYFMIKQS